MRLALVLLAIGAFLVPAAVVAAGSPSPAPSPVASPAASDDVGAAGIRPVASEEAAAAGGNTVIASTPEPESRAPESVTKQSLVPGMALVAVVGLVTLAFVGAGFLLARRNA